MNNKTTNLIVCAKSEFEWNLIINEICRRYPFLVGRLEADWKGYTEKNDNVCAFIQLNELRDKQSYCLTWGSLDYALANYPLRSIYYFADLERFFKDIETKVEPKTITIKVAQDEYAVISEKGISIADIEISFDRFAELVKNVEKFR